MATENIVVVKKKHRVLKIITILLAIGAACVVAAKIYQKYFKNKKVGARPLTSKKFVL